MTSTSRGGLLKMVAVTFGLCALLAVVLAPADAGAAGPRYVRQMAGAARVIVFVHGVLGNGASTWTARNKAYWPEMMTKDSTFNDFDIYVYEYPTEMAGSVFSIDEIADNMRLFFDADGVSAHSEVVFVVHSMGGLALRAYLTKYRNIAPKTRLVYFFSTPTTGSEIASLAALISANPQLAEMRPMRSVDYLADLQRQWLAAELGIASYCAYEKRPTYGIQVVTQASASNMCNKRLDPIDEDHVTIVKPTDMRHPSYLALKSALSQTVSSLAAAADSARNAATEPNPNPAFPKGTVLKTAEGAALTIESELHAGAESAIFLAKARSGDTVAVKIFWKGLGPNSPAWQHFKNEQQAAESLSHRNIIRILDTGIVGGYPFTVMEYFSGRSLKEWLEARDRMPGPDILSVATQIAEAIDFAHSKGIVHRDIKPSNILIESTPQGRVVLSDFGVARVFGAIQRNITVSGNELVGSPDFLAPEAIKGQEISEKSDIYSFGVVLYEMIAGKDPFAHFEIASALLNAKTNEDAPDIRQFRKNVPKVIAVRLGQTLSRDPSKRPQSAAAVLRGIEDAIRGL